MRTQEEPRAAVAWQPQLGAIVPALRELAADLFGEKVRPNRGLLLLAWFGPVQLADRLEGPLDEPRPLLPRRLPRLEPGQGIGIPGVPRAHGEPIHAELGLAVDGLQDLLPLALRQTEATRASRYRSSALASTTTSAPWFPSARRNRSKVSPTPSSTVIRVRPGWARLKNTLRMRWYVTSRRRLILYRSTTHGGTFSMMKSNPWGFRESSPTNSSSQSSNPRPPRRTDRMS
jgi:hypothetical protein